MVKHFFDFDVVQKNRLEEVEDLEGDIRDKAKKENWGKIDKVLIFDLEPDGLIQVRFTKPEDAEHAKTRLDGRFFDGKQLEAWVMEKKAAYRKTFYED